MQPKSAKSRLAPHRACSAADRKGAMIGARKWVAGWGALPLPLPLRWVRRDSSACEFAAPSAASAAADDDDDDRGARTAPVAAEPPGRRNPPVRASRCLATSSRPWLRRRSTPACRNETSSPLRRNEDLQIRRRPRAGGKREDCKNSSSGDQRHHVVIKIIMTMTDMT